MVSTEGMLTLVENRKWDGKGNLKSACLVYCTYHTLDEKGRNGRGGKISLMTANPQRRSCGL